MPRSSRSKSHKQSKHSSSSATAREYSGSDEDVKVKEKSSGGGINGGKEDSVRVSSEKRKHIKDLIVSHLNGDVNEEYPKRREEKVREGGSDRWNGGSSDEKGLDVLGKSKDLSKTTGSESKVSSSSSKRNDGESVGVGVGVGVSLDKDRGEKRKSDKEYVRKESGSSSSQYVKELKDKDRGRKSHSDKVETEALSNQSTKRGKEITEWPIEEELRNPELEKELEKRMRRRGEGSSDKDKYQDDAKEAEDRRLSSRTERSKDERHKNEEYVDVVREDSIKETRQRDEKHREDGDRDRKNRDTKHRGESERYNKHREDKYRDDKYSEDGNKDNKYKDEKYMEIGEKDERSRDGKRKQDDDRDYRHKEDKHRDVRHRDEPDREKRARDSKYASRDHPVEPETKRLRDDGIAGELYHRKTNNRDGSPIYDDRVARYKDDKDRRRANDKDESSDYRSRSMKEQRSESEKRSSAKVESVAERGRPGSRYADAEITASHSRRRSSPSGSSYPARDQHRVSKHEESKYRDYAYEDRARHNVHSSRDYSSVPGQSEKKVTPKDDSYLRPDSRSSPQVDKSPSSTSNERRNLNRSDTRRSLDLEEPGPRSGGSKDAVKDGKGSRDLAMEAHPDNDFSQVDHDNLSASSPYTRNNHFSEDDRNKSNNRHRRMADPNMGRSQGNWKNVPNWPSPMPTGGYIPFQHVPPPMFHPLMQQFPPPMFGRPPMKLNPGLPYHVPDHGRPIWQNQVDESGQPQLHGWDANNAVFTDESHLYGRLDWDRRNQLNNRGWEQSSDMWKSQNAGAGMDGQSGPQKDGYSTRGPTDEIWSGQTGQPDEIEQNQLDIQAEALNLERNAPEVQKVTEIPQVSDAVKEDNSILISQAYLSRIDVSQDLTQPELYEKCISMMDLDQDSLSDDFDCKILFLEESVESNITNGASLFTPINDSVFQKAMFLYKKQKEELHLMNNKNSSPEFVPPFNKEMGGSDGDGKPVEEVAAEGIDEVSKDDDAPPIQNLDTEANVSDKPSKTEEPINMEVDYAILKQDEEPELTVAPVEESLAPSAGDLLPCKVEEESQSANDEKIGGGDGSLSDMSTTGAAVIPPTESIEFGSVNLNRIHHHSHESTH